MYISDDALNSDFHQLPDGRYVHDDFKIEDLDGNYHNPEAEGETWVRDADDDVLHIDNAVLINDEYYHSDSVAYVVNLASKSRERVPMSCYDGSLSHLQLDSIIRCIGRENAERFRSEHYRVINNNNIQTTLTLFYGIKCTKPASLRTLISSNIHNIINTNGSK
jgi:hypothetical protein